MCAEYLRIKHRCLLRWLWGGKKKSMIFIWVLNKKSWKARFCGGFSSQEKGWERTFILVTGPAEGWPSSSAAGGAVQVQWQQLCQGQGAAGERFPQNKSSWPKAVLSSKPQLFSTMWGSGRFSSPRDHAHYSNNSQRCCIHCQDIIHISKQFPASGISWFST